MRGLSGRVGLLAAVLAGTLVLALASCGQRSTSASDGTDSAPASSSQCASDRAAAPGGSTRVAGLPDFSRLVRSVAPAVVNISAIAATAEPSGGAGTDDSSDSAGSRPMRGATSRIDLEQGPAAPDAPETGHHVSLGSGFIISADGYVLTNRHVIRGAGQIVVKLNDRRQLLARVVGSDPGSDIAVLKIPAHDLPVVRIGDPGRLPVGAWVVAIGSPFGFETSVTAGIVSAKGRSLTDDRYVPFLQTDVAINPGNSGGPLFDLAGEVVGINAQIYTESGGYQGISFAIPIDVAMRVAHQLRTRGRVTRGWLGVEIQSVGRRLARSFGLSRPEGALITRIMRGSPAAAAGLRVGDVILGVDDRPVDSATDLPPLIGVLAPGDVARLRVWRDGRVRREKITVSALPPRAGAGAGTAPEAPPRPGKDFGLTLGSLNVRQRRALGLDRGGVSVLDVAPGPGQRAGLRIGDVILAVGRTDVASRRGLLAALHAASGPVALLILRDGVRRYLPMQVGPNAGGG